MLYAIITQLKTGALTRVYPRDTLKVNPKAPYVVVFETTLLESTVLFRGQMQFFVSVHYKKGNGDLLDDYIRDTLLTLLDEQILTDRHGNKRKVYVEDDISPLTALNDDGTISRDRLITVASIHGG